MKKLYNYLMSEAEYVTDREFIKYSFGVCTVVIFLAMAVMVYSIFYGWNQANIKRGYYDNQKISIQKRQLSDGLQV